MELTDLIDVEGVQSLVDDLYALTHIPSAIIDLKGKVLVGAGWQDICTRFHRQHAETLRHCIESDTQLSQGVPAGASRLYKCKNNMWDVATPIVVGGHHVGNVFSGQFFFEDEPVDRELFRAQAGRYGFDEPEYLAALDRVPRLRRKSLDTAMALFAKLAQQLAQLSHGAITLARSLAERDALMASLETSHRDLDRAQAVAHTGSWRLDVREGKLLWSKETYRIFGIPQGIVMTHGAFLGAVHPDDRMCVDQKWTAALGGEPYDLEHRIVVAGEVKWVRERAELDFDADGSLLGGFGTFQDVTEPRRTQNELLQLNRTLRALGQSSQALMHATEESAYLEEVCRIITEDCGHAMVWIGYAEYDEAKTVRPMAYAGFESGYLDTLKITWADTERGRGPTGTAIRTAEPCFCRNMLTDPAFVPWREQAIRRGYASSIVLPLKVDGTAFGAVTIYSREPDPFSPDEITLLIQVADDLAFGITTLRLRAAHARVEEQQARAWHLDQALITIDSAVHSSLAFDEIVRRALSQATEALCAESAAVSLRRAPGKWRVQHVHGLPDEMIGFEMDDEEERHAVLAARTGHVVAVEDAEQDDRVNREHLRRWGILSVLTVPLVSRGETIGVMFFNFTSRRCTFSDEAIDFARRVGATVSLALENARLYGEQRQIADTLQKALLSVPEELPGLAFGHLHRSATENAEVGGDFYDLFPLSGQKVGIILGDVSGKGIEAANMAALAKNTIRAYAHRHDTPAQVLADTNHLLIESSGQQQFVSAFFGLLDLPTGTLTYSSAGHPPAVLQPARGKVRWLNRTGPVLGVLPEAEFTDATAILAEGDLLLLYTDGLTEARRDGRLYGETRLLACLESHRGALTSEIPGRLLQAALTFTSGALADDLAILALERVHSQACLSEAL